MKFTNKDSVSDKIYKFANHQALEHLNWQTQVIEYQTWGLWDVRAQVKLELKVKVGFRLRINPIQNTISQEIKR